MRRTVTALLILSALALLAGYTGRFHGAGDSISLGRPVVAPVLALFSVIALMIGPRLPGAFGLALASAAGLSLWFPAPGANVPEEARHYTAYQKNLLWRLRDVAPVAEDIQRQEADFVTLQELHQRNRPILERLRRAFPHQHFCPFEAVGGLAVLSRWPPTETAPVCDDGDGLAALQVATPDGPLWVVSLHLHWPFPYGQRNQLDRLLPLLHGLEGPVVLGGDFNMVPWSYATKAVERATRTSIAGYAGGTFEFSYHRHGRNLAIRMPKLPIDHVLVANTGTALSLTRRPLFGSDHHGLVASFALDRP